MRFRLMILAGLALVAAPVAMAERVVISIYFEWGVTTLDKVGLAVIDAALPRINACGQSGFSVIGHADRSHSEAESSELATARAKAVRDALVAKGVRTSLIGVVGRSENQPATPTADGVREAKNRRAEIVLVCD